MITLKLISNMNANEISQSNNLIDTYFDNNRFTDYKSAILYKKDGVVIGFVGIYDNLLNQICTDINYRREGIATEMISTCKKLLKGTISLYIDKNKKNTNYLLQFYQKNNFNIELENEVEYKMSYKK